MVRLEELVGQVGEVAGGYGGCRVRWKGEEGNRRGVLI